MKGVSGKVVTTIIALVTAVIALIIIWLFLSKAIPSITKTVEEFARSMACKICKTVLVWGVRDILCRGC